MKKTIRWNTPGGAQVVWEAPPRGQYGSYTCGGCGKKDGYSEPDHAQDHALGCHALPD
ncbi:hypothetical protein [Streptosporangium sp. NPDC020145]|uniref:hypothetical protein n=1 Tax=Streptosporangium sp. NPDC020145 TaxID=3154694 RepID=UPI00343A48B6